MPKWYCDGSGFNGRTSGYAVVPPKGAPIIVIEPIDKTNNVREYEAVICALGQCGIGDEILTDSALVVNQVNGKWRVKEKHLQPLCDTARQMMNDKSAKLAWVPREENLAGKYF
jgi:ribonuclease HI